jgi:hypothetical protein
VEQLQYADLDPVNAIFADLQVRFQIYRKS